MVAVVRESELRGSIEAPPSKSYTHRALICAALANGKSRIHNFLDCDDTRETVAALRKFGVGIQEEGTALNVSGSGLKAPEKPVEITASGTTYRFLLSLAAMVEGKTRIEVRGRLAERPVEPLLDALKQLGAGISKGKDYVTLDGKIKGGRAMIPGNVSSQFISGLLFIAPLTKDGIDIQLTTELESRPYVDMSLSVMRDFGIDAGGLEVKGKQSYEPMEYEVEGDYSSAAFLLAAGAINGEVEVTGLEKDSLQGDRRIIKILKDMGAEIEISDSVKTGTSDLKGIDINVEDVPDLVPILSVLGCFSEGKTGILNAGRLRGKESDRIAALSRELEKMGAGIEGREDSISVRGGELSGARIDPHNDHRIAMACAVAGLNAEGETVIENPSSVEKSYPGFFRDLKRLGGDITHPEE